MIAKIVAGISGALHKTFGESYMVYADRVEQGLCPPCFSIVLLSCTEKPGIGGRKRSLLPFDILFFSPCSGKQQAIWEIGMRMKTALQQIQVDGMPMNGSKIRWEQSDGVLHFYVNYNYESIVIGTADKMETVRCDSDVKGA